jgi:type IV secretory pathway VirJ component
LSRVLGALVGVALAVCFGAPARSALPPPVDGGTLGPLRLVMPVGEPQRLVFLFSDLAGPTAEFDRAAQRLAEAGAVVAPVDLEPFLARQDALPRDCLYLVADIEEASRRIQAQGGRRRYLTPIVAGTGMGAAVAYAALAQAPDATLNGAASDGFATRIATTKPLCAGAPFTPAAAGGFEYGPTNLPGWWRMAPAADETEAAAAFAAAAGAEDALVPPAIEGGLGERLAALLDPALVTPAENGLAGLPLVELPVATAAGGGLVAVVYSGDGGWRDLDKEIAGRLQAEGIPVVGVDSLRYFWSEKTPDQVAADLATILAHYRVAWRRPDVLLVGYSFGADVLPFAYNRLPEDEKARVRRMALLGLARSADFEIHVTGWLGVDAHTGSRSTAPELARISPELVQCFYGAEEHDTACTLPELKGAELVRTAGGHHFDGDYGKLADAILASVARR